MLCTGVRSLLTRHPWAPGAPSSSTTMSRKRTLQQGAMALAFASYVGYVAFDRFTQHDETALENAKRRGRARGEAIVRRKQMEDDAAAAAALAAAAGGGGGGQPPTR